MSQVLGEIAQKISKEIGTSATASYRIAKKLDGLASVVDWAAPIERPRGASRTKLARIRIAKKSRSKRARKRK
jgi:hypothetical protein